LFQSTTLASGTVYPIYAEPIHHAAKLQELQREKKIKELLEYVINTNSWMAEKSKQLDSKSKVISAEQWLSLLDEIEKKAEAVGYQPSADERKSMQGIKRFFSTADKRSGTMVGKVVQLVQQHAEAPVAMVIGAAHTDGVCRLFDEQKTAYTLIRPNSLGASKYDANSISFAAFGRKGKKLSVDAQGFGALLDDRKRPPPVVSTPWFQAKADLYVVTDIIAAAATSQDNRVKPPFGLDPEKDLNLGMVRVDPSTLERVGDDVMFKVLVSVDPRNPTELWVRTRSFGTALPTGNIADVGDQEIEKLLLEAWGGGDGKQPPGGRDPARFDENPDRPGGPPKPPGPPLVQVSSDTLAMASRVRETIVRKEI